MARSTKLATTKPSLRQKEAKPDAPPKERSRRKATPQAEECHREHERSSEDWREEDLTWWHNWAWGTL